MEDACIREVYEETNIKVKVKSLIGVFSDPKREPRGHNAKIAFLCVPVSKDEKTLAKDDAVTIEIVKLEVLDFKKLVFDYFKIIKYSGILKNQQ